MVRTHNGPKCFDSMCKTGGGRKGCGKTKVGRPSVVPVSSVHFTTGVGGGR